MRHVNEVIEEMPSKLSDPAECHTTNVQNLKIVEIGNCYDNCQLNYRQEIENTRCDIVNSIQFTNAID